DGWRKCVPTPAVTARGHSMEPLPDDPLQGHVVASAASALRNTDLIAYLERNRQDLHMHPDLNARAAHSAEIRQRAAAEMKAIGVDEAFISTLVDTFYGRVLAHPELGPVFDARLAGRWPQHMEKMKAFWSSVAFRSGAYGGKPVQAHMGV